MKNFILPVFVVALGSLSLAFGDVDVPSNLSENLKKAAESLGKMGLTIERAGNRFIGGKVGVAVHRAAIIEEEGKSFVVVLDENDPSKSERIEVKLGDQSGDYFHARNGVSPGDYVVARVEDLMPEQPDPVPVLPPAKVQEKQYANQAPISLAIPTPTYEPETPTIWRRPPPVQVREPEAILNPAPAPVAPPVRLFSESGNPRPAPQACEICRGYRESIETEPLEFQPETYRSFAYPDFPDGYVAERDRPERDRPRFQKQNREYDYFNETFPAGYDPFFEPWELESRRDTRSRDTGCGFEKIRSLFPGCWNR